MQIIGSAKSRDTKKCRLWFDQRAVSYHFVDLAKRPLSPGELRNIAAGRSWEDLIDRNSRAWEERQLSWKDYDPQEELTEHQDLLVLPVLRDGRDTVVGFNPEEWDRIAKKHSVGGGS